jgi:hypothetical protein
MESPSAVMSSRVRAKPTLPRFAGRRRNMPSKSTIPAFAQALTIEEALPIQEALRIKA